MISGKKMATLAAVAVTGLSLVGLGAGASFTDHTQATQYIHAGTLAMEASLVDADFNPITANVDVTHTVAGRDHDAAISVSLENTGSAVDTGVQYVKFTNVGTLPTRPSACGLDPAGANDSPLNSEVMWTVWGYSVDQLQKASFICVATVNPGQSWYFPYQFRGSLSSASMGQSISPTWSMDWGEALPGLAASEAPHVTVGDQTLDVIVK